MSSMNKFLEKWIWDRQRRYILFTCISCVFIFLLPILGWIPLLLLWIINCIIVSKETDSNKVRIFCIVLAAVFGVQIVINVCMEIWVLLEYFGFFY